VVKIHFRVSTAACRTPFRRESLFQWVVLPGRWCRCGDGLALIFAVIDTLRPSSAYNPESINGARQAGEGLSNCWDGRRGYRLRVPVATQVHASRNRRACSSISRTGDPLVCAKADERFGNSFCHVDNRAPRYQSRRKRGRGTETYQLNLSFLRCVACWFPNAGKSTLIQRFLQPNSRLPIIRFQDPLRPHLGVVDLGDFRTFGCCRYPGVDRRCAYGSRPGAIGF